MFDVASGARQRLTSNRSDVSPRFVGTERQVAFVRGESGTPDVVVKPADAAGEERIVARGARFPSATSDGRRLVFNALSSSPGVWEVAWIDADAPSTVHRLGAPHRGARFRTCRPTADWWRTSRERQGGTRCT
jgi:hypothetical protein